MRACGPSRCRGIYVLSLTWQGSAVAEGGGPRNEANNGRRRVVANDRSNKKDQSRDAAFSFAESEWIRHLSAGGTYSDRDGTLQRPGAGLSALFAQPTVRTACCASSLRRPPLTSCAPCPLAVS